MAEVLEKTLNHPYLKQLKNTLVTQKTLKECLEKRLYLIHLDYANKSEYEKNEIEITKIKTQGEIDVLKRVINEKENYFIKFMQGFVKDLEEMDANYDTVLKKATDKSHKDIGLNNILKSVNWAMVNESLEVKVHLYKRLKDLI
jgi:hypothetical protein